MLPPYSPENSTGQIWHILKSHNISRKVVSCSVQLKSIVMSQLRKLQKLPKIIKAIFKHPALSYTTG
jgi:hypothetical protein